MMSASGTDPLLSALAQVKIFLITIFLVSLVDVLVAVQAHRWLRLERGSSQPSLLRIRRLCWGLLALELAHVVLLGLEVETVLNRLVGVEPTAARLAPTLAGWRLELGGRFVWITIAAAVQSCFTWRAFKVTKKRCTKIGLVFFWASLALVAIVVLTLYSISLARTGTIFSRPANIATCTFLWLGFGQNIALLWVFYKELVFDRRNTAHDRDAVTEFALQAISHESPLFFVCLVGAVGSSQFTVLGVYINGICGHLYSPLCLLSGFTALLSHDELHHRVHPSAAEHVSNQANHVKSNNNDNRNNKGVVKVNLATTADDPSLWRADVSRVSQHADRERGPAIHKHIQVEYTVERAVELDEPMEEDKGYFSFDLDALEKAKPAVIRPSVRFGAHTLPAAIGLACRPRHDEHEHKERSSMGA